MNIVFLLDVDNTLLDNDKVTADLKRHLGAAFGARRQERYWAIFEELRKELGYADYLGALQRYRAENPRDPNFLTLSHYMLEYPFANRIYPGAIDMIEQFNDWGQSVVLSDGDVIFQPRKIERSGILEAVAGRVLIYVHKELELPDVEARFPADHYVMVDDKIRILTEMKKFWGSKLTTIFPRQGHYALDPQIVSQYPPADLTVERVGEVVKFDLDTIVAAAKR